MRALPLSFLTTLVLMPALTQADLLVEASLQAGANGGGLKVDMFKTCTTPSGAGCGDANLSEIGLIDSAQGVTFIATETDQQSNAVLSWYLRGMSPDPRTLFRSTGTVSIAFKADLARHVGGQLLTDYYGFNQFNNGQSVFGATAGRNTGADGITGTADDRLSFGWSTWHNNVWYYHIPANTVQVTYDQWHRVGFAWGGPTNQFELWVDGERLAYANPFAGVYQPWGATYLGLGSATNFALGDIHQRGVDQENGTSGMTFAHIRIWNEYVPMGDSLAPIPEPETWALMLAGLGVIGWAARRRG